MASESLLTPEQSSRGSWDLSEVLQSQRGDQSTDDDPPRRRHGKSPEKESIAVKRLACPFWKSNPSQYKSCFNHRFYGLTRLGQHLRRCHTLQCKTCLATFSRKVDLEEHLDTSSECVVGPDSFGPSGEGFTYSISTADWAAISDVGRRRPMRIEDSWERIWHVLFPKRPAPPSPYAETDYFSPALFLFCQHLTSTGSQELSDLFERKRLCRESIAPADISEFLEGFYRDWALRQESITSTDKDERRNQESSALSPESRLDGKASVPNEAKTLVRTKPIDPDTPPTSGTPRYTGESVDSGFMESASPPPLAAVKGSDLSSPVSNNERSDNGSSPLTDESGSQTSSEGTRSLDIFEFGDILVPDGSRFSSALSAAVRALTVIYERESQIVTSYGMPGAASDPTDAPEFSPPQNTPSDSAGSAASSSIHSLPTELTSQASSQRGDTRQKRGREEDDEPKKSALLKRKRIENGAKRLACPFQKRYPLKHFFCGARGETRGFVHVSHIKNHIHRCHIRSVLYCPNCKEDFVSSEKFAEHVMEQSCEKQPFRDETALPRTAALAASLKARVGKALSLSEQWFSVWRILFPGEDEPGSCFVDDVPENMFQYQQFITRRGDEIVLDVIRAHGLLSDRDQPPGDDPECAQRNEEELVAFAQRVFGLATEAIFQSWVADAHQTHRAIPSGEQARQNSDTPMNKGKVLETDRTAPNRPDQTNDEIPPITQAPPTVSTHSAVQTVPGGIVMGQGANEVEYNTLTTSNPMHHRSYRSLSDVIQPMTTAARVLHGSALPSPEMALNQAGDQEPAEGNAEGSDSSRDAVSNNAGISLEEYLGLLKPVDSTWNWCDPTIFGPQDSDSGTYPPPC